MASSSSPVSSLSDVKNFKNPAFYVFGKERRVVDLGVGDAVVDRLQELVGVMFTTVPTGPKFPKKIIAYCNDEGLINGLIRNYVGELLLVDGLSCSQNICKMGIMGPLVLVQERKKGMLPDVIDILAEMIGDVLDMENKDGEDDPAYVAKLETLRSSLLEKLRLAKKVATTPPARKKARASTKDKKSE